MKEETQCKGVNMDDRMNILYRSLVTFLIDHVPENTQKSAIELYKEWSEVARIRVKDPKVASFILEYFELQKQCDRNVIIEAAKIDGYI